MIIGHDLDRVAHYDVTMDNIVAMCTYMTSLGLMQFCDSWNIPLENNSDDLHKVITYSTVLIIELYLRGSICFIIRHMDGVCNDVLATYFRNDYNIFTTLSMHVPLHWVLLTAPSVSVVVFPGQSTQKSCPPSGW